MCIDNLLEREPFLQLIAPGSAARKPRQRIGRGYVRFRALKQPQREVRRDDRWHRAHADRRIPRHAFRR